MKLLVVFLSIFLSMISFSQEQVSLKAVIDSSSVKIGEQINYTLQVKVDSTAKVLFPEEAIFSPFEVLEVGVVDTIRSQSNYIYTKKYALIQFDSGNYYLPQQQVFVNGFSKIADIIPIRVNSVLVDTTKQKLYDIKPIENVEKNYESLITQILWILVFVIVLFGILYTYLFRKRRKELKEKELPPFERAIKELRALENKSLAKQEEFKNYYSRLTEVVRRYLEEEAKIDALESTSEELLTKLEIQKNSGILELEIKTLKSLRKVLQNADLVKFAKSMPEYYIASEDRKAVETVVIETKEALPEPSQEELLEKAEYQEYLLNKRRKEQWIWGLSGVGIFGILALIVSMLIYGYYPVRDTLLGYPTKKLETGQWVLSQYGTPPLRIETPEVLERIERDETTIQQFELGSFEDPFYIKLLFDFPRESQQKNEIPYTDPKKADLEKGRVLVNSIISNFESKGAVNILIKNDALELSSGVPVTKIHGTLDYPKKSSSKLVRCSFNALLFTFQEGTIILNMMYDKEDRYAHKIEKRIIKSLELIKEL